MNTEKDEDQRWEFGSVEPPSMNTESQQQIAREEAEKFCSDVEAQSTLDGLKYATNRQVMFVKFLSAIERATPQVWTDGYCPKCSRYSHELTRALEKVGVPTGATEWPKRWGAAKVLELEDYKNALRRVLQAIKEGDANEREAAIKNAEFYFELHAKRYRERLAAAQPQRSETQASSGDAARSMKHVLDTARRTH